MDSVFVVNYGQLSPVVGRIHGSAHNNPGCPFSIGVENDCLLTSRRVRAFEICANCLSVSEINANSPADG